MSQGKPQAVIFDLAETLLNFGPFHAHRLFFQAARITHTHLKEQKQPVGPFWAYLSIHLVQMRWAYTLGNMRRRDFDSLQAIRSIGSGMGFTLSDDQWEEVAWLWYKPVRRSVVPETHVTETMQRLQAQGLKLAILSNTFIHASALRRHLDELGWLQHFHTCLFSYAFAFRKPDRRIFHEAARRLDVPFEQTVFVGDNIRNDIRPALELGMHPVLKRAYTNTRKRIPEKTWVIDRIAQVPGILESIRRGQPASRLAPVSQSA